MRSADIAVLQERVIGFRDLLTLKAVVPEYAIIAGGSSAQIALAQLSRMPTFVAKVTAPEHADALFDGITRDPRNFSGAPLDSPIQIDFSETVSVSELKVALWDFDGRSYRFLVEGFSGGQWKTLGEWAGSGEIAVPLLGQQMSGLRLIGKDNSNLLQNPANRVFHVLELVITASP